MSRSYREPYGYSQDIKQKDWKRSCNRALRSMEDVPNGRAYRKMGGDIWDSPNDGYKELVRDKSARRK